MHAIKIQMKITFRRITCKNSLVVFVQWRWQWIPRWWGK